jgi:hypothetical protein
MSQTKEVGQERRITAGLRGATWDAATVPGDMRTSVHVLQTADGAQVIGYLHARGPEASAAIFMHPRELLVAHYLVPYLVRAGIACWMQGPRTVGNDLRLEHEMAIQDVAAGIVELRRLGFEQLVLVGNSGGASLFAFYNQQARLTPDQRLERTPAGRPTKLAKAAMPEVDAFVFLAPHPGQGRLLRDAIDPSVTDEEDPFSKDPSLDPFSRENGFRPAEEGGASYAPDFVLHYRKAQAERVARIDARARALVEARRSAREGGRENSAHAAYAGLFHVWRTDADLRCYDLSLDPSDRRWGSVWGADPLASNYGSVGFGRVCTPESWLSTWSALSSRASFADCGPSIDKPTLQIEYTGDNTVFPGVADEIFASIGASRKTRRKIRANHHGQPLAAGEPSGQVAAAAAFLEWHASLSSGPS